MINIKGGNLRWQSDLCHVKLRVYNYIAQPEPDPFINGINVD